MNNTEGPKRYQCLPLKGLAYPSVGIRPPNLYKYPEPNLPVSLLFLGWNPPRPFGGFWSLETEDNLRRETHSLLKKLGQIDAQTPDRSFLDEFLEKGFYFIHTVKCWTEAKFPGFGADGQSTGGRIRRSQVGLPLLYSCVRTHLGNELKSLDPQRVCALGELPFLGLCDLYPMLKTMPAIPTQGNVYHKETCGLPWPLLFTCFPQSRSIPIKGTKRREKALKIVFGHLQTFLKI